MQKSVIILVKFIINKVKALKISGLFLRSGAGAGLDKISFTLFIIFYFYEIREGGFACWN